MTSTPAWVVEVWIDADWYALQNSPDPLPSAGPPAVLPLGPGPVLIGRASRTRGVAPDVSCDADTGVSRRQAELRLADDRWSVIDLGSANGTFVQRPGTGLPRTPIAGPVELNPGDSIYVGAWTRLAVRPASPARPGGDDQGAG